MSFKCVSSDQINSGREVNRTRTPDLNQRDTTQLNEHYQEKLGFNQEDDDTEEEKEVSFYIFLLIFCLPSILSSVIQVEKIHDMFVDSECVPEERWFFIKWVRRQAIKHPIHPHSSLTCYFSSEGFVEHRE